MHSKLSHLNFNRKYAAKHVQTQRH